MNRGSSGSGPITVERVVVREVQPDPAELADVAEPELAAVVERQHEPQVRILPCVAGHDEQLAGHLEVDREERAAGQVDDELLAAPPDRLDPPARRRPPRRRRGRPSRSVRGHSTRAPVSPGRGPPPLGSRWRRRSRATVSTSGSSGIAVTIGQVPSGCDARTGVTTATPRAPWDPPMTDEIDLIRARQCRPDRRERAVLRERRDRRLRAPRLPAIKDSLDLTNSELGVALPRSDRWPG